MGSWYGSIQLRTEDRPRVLQALAELADQTKLKFYLGPTLGGWIGVYPKEHGQDAQTGHALVQKLGCEAFHLIVCDDDVFAYNFFRNGRLTDEYWSTPGYYSEQRRAEDEQQCGNPQCYAHLLGDALPAVTRLLQRASRHVEDEYQGCEGDRLQCFAELLGIQNVVTAYEYLADKEVTGITRWHDFLHVPDQVSEKEAAKRRKDRLKQQVQDLQDRGLLLAEYRGKNDRWPTWCVDHSSTGFLISWQDVLRGGGGQLERVAPPWPRKAVEVAIAVPPRISAVATSNSGRYLATSAEDSLRLWDVSTRKKVLDLPGAVGSLSITFSDDDRLLMSLDRDQVRVISLPDGATLATIGTCGGQVLAIDPTSSVLLIDRQLNLLMVPLGREDEQRTLYVGGRSNLTAVVGQAVRRQLAQIEAADFDAVAHKAAANQIGRLAAALVPKKGQASVAAELQANMQEEMKKGLAAVKDWMAKAKSGDAIMPNQAAERVACLRFSSDGTRLFCGTNQGLRVYRWADVVAGGENLDQPEYAYNTPTQDGSPGAYVYSLVEDAARRDLLFAGIDGVVRRMNLVNGQVSEILVPPERDAIIRMAPSRDRTALACVCQPGLGDVARVRERNSPYFRIWDYRRVLGY